MSKIGRNERCHCGSGKKYKRCCLDKDEQLRMIQTVQYPVHHFLTYDEVNELSTDAIIHNLRQMGIPFNQEAFLIDVDTFYSAEEISENWFSQYTVIASGRDEDFPWLAAWILWERLAPENYLSMEQMSNLIDQGYQYLDKNDSISACDIWLKVWEAIKDKIKPTIKSLDDLDKHYRGSFFVGNFCQDLEAELYNAGLDDRTYFEKRTKFCSEFCEFFPKGNELIIHNMRRFIAESYAKLDQYEDAEIEFEKLVQDFPDNPWGYIGWGDLFFFEHKKDYNKARYLYEKALAIAKDEGDIQIIRERLENLKEEL